MPAKPTAGDKGPISVRTHLCLCMHSYCMRVCAPARLQGLNVCVCMCVRGFNEALLTQHISPGMCDSRARLSDFA